MVLLDWHIDHVAVDTRGNLDEVAVHLGIVRVFVEGRVPVEQQHTHEKDRDHKDDDESAPGLCARLVLRIRLRIALGSILPGLLAGCLCIRCLFCHLLASHVLLQVGACNTKRPRQR